MTKAMREAAKLFGKMGGKASSRAKIEAAKKNGKKGGRPKKVTAPSAVK